MKGDPKICGKCRYYVWYYDRCKKWECEVDETAVYPCFTQREDPTEETLRESKETSRKSKRFMF